MAITLGQDTYQTVAGADTYWAARNNSTWAAATTEAKEAALLEATQYLDSHFNWIGRLVDFDQPLGWPRAWATIRVGNFAGKDFGTSEIPEKLKRACAELALEALSERLSPNLDRGGAIRREKVGELEVEYFNWAPSRKTYSFVRQMLRDIVTGTPTVRKVLR